MEPAVYRREHLRKECGNDRAKRSQWSPPFIGGSTRPLSLVSAQVRWSQWSPPFIGGSTGADLAAVGAAVIVAMEPAVYRREHSSTPTARACRTASQWSPPFIGGSTRLSCPYHCPAGLVAMEPAVYRREHVSVHG